MHSKETEIKMVESNNPTFGTGRAFVLIALFAVLIGLAIAQENRTLRWYKGNTHTHTINSDGDSTPDEVVRWYREHGYNFLVLSDHNYLTEVDGLNAVFGAANKFIVIKGEEVSDKFQEKPAALKACRTSITPIFTGRSAPTI
jgi:hypothetical protein